MKKMICEICGSQSIRKENGVFVCQECGTEYSLEEAKNLLKDIDVNSGEEAVAPSKEEEKKEKAFLTAPKEKDQLINVLHAWYEYALSIERVSYFFSNFDLPSYNYTPEIIKNAKLKYIRELTIDDFNKKPYDAQTRKKYIRFTYKQLSNGAISCADDPYFPLSFFVSDVEREYQSFVFQNKELISKYVGYKSERIGPMLTRSYTRNTIVRSKSNKRPYLWIDYKFNDLAKTFSAVVKDILFVDRLNFDDLEVITTERMSESGYIEEKIGVFKNKTVSRRVENSSQKEFAPPFADTILSFFKKIYDYINVITRFQQEQYDYLNGCVSKVKESYLSLVNDEPIYVKMFDLPQRYRSSQAISALIELVFIGRADSWKEAMNLYEEDKYHANVLGGLSAINSNLGRINTTLIQGFSYLGQKLDMTSQQLDKLIDNTNKSLNIGSEIADGINKVANKKEYIDFNIGIDISTIIKV